MGKKPDICFKLCKLRVVHFFFEAGVSLVTSNISAHMGNRVNFYYFEVKPKRAILLKTQKKKKKKQNDLISLSNQVDVSFQVSKYLTSENTKLKKL